MCYSSWTFNLETCHAYLQKDFTVAYFFRKRLSLTSRNDYSANPGFVGSLFCALSSYLVLVLVLKNFTQTCYSVSQNVNYSQLVSALFSPLDCSLNWVITVALASNIVIIWMNQHTAANYVPLVSVEEHRSSGKLLEINQYAGISFGQKQLALARY